MAIKFLNTVAVDTDVLYVDASSNNVGIGTTSPNINTKLHLYSALSATDVALRLTSNPNSKTLIGFGDTVDQTAGAIKYDNSNSSMAFEVLNSTEAMRINSSGNVGIGTTVPLDKLHVNGRVRTSTDGVVVGDTNAVIYRNSNDLELITYGGFDINLMPSGNVGIGTTDPGAKLHLVGTDVNQLFIERTGSITGKYRFGIAGSNNRFYIRDEAQGQDRIVIYQNGNVGIGTTSPSAKLDVNGAGNFSGGTVVSGIDTNTNVGVAIAKGDYLYSDDGNYLRRLIGQQSGGSIDIGQQGTGLISNINFFPGTSGNIDFFSSGSIDMRVASSGNVGIGTTSPVAKLHISNGGVTPSSVTQNNKNLTISGNDAIIDLLSYDDNTTVATSLGMGRYSQVNGNLIDKWGLVTWYDTGNEGSNLSDRLSIHYGTSGTPWGSGEKVSITREGNVGIGTTNPSEKLEVAGNARITGDVTLSNGNALRWTSDDVRIEGTTAGDNIKFYVANTEILQLAQSGTLATVTGNLRVTGAYYDSNNLPGTSGQVLSSTATGTDWVSLSEISGVDGTGTTNYVAKWSDTDTITDSVIYDNGTNVGIGTTSPSQKLTIRDDSTTVYSTGDAGTNTGDFVLQNNNQTVNNFNRISFQTTSNNNQTGDLLDAARITAIYPDHAGSNPSGELAFETKPDAGSMAEAMRIDRDGNVGIGTASPLSILQVGGGTAANLPITFAPATGGNVELRNTKITGSFTFTNANGNSEKMRIDSAGNVGIGTTLPSGKIHLLGAYNSQFFTQSTGGTTNKFGITSGTAYAAFTVGSSLTQAARFYHDNSYITFAENGANVGIGTTSPSSKLHIKQSVDSIDGGLTWESVDGTQEWSIDANNAGNFRIYKGTTPIARFDSLGNFGIGTTSPGYKLDVNGDAYISVNNSLYLGNANSRITSNSSADILHFPNRHHIFGSVISGADVERMRITEDGNVGIGTTSPSYKLSVNGNIQTDIINGYTYPNNSWLDFDYDQTLASNMVALASIGTIVYLADTNNNASASTPAHLFTTASGDVDSATRLLNINTNGSIQFNQYGSGTFTGTATQRLGVDSSGNVIEIPIGSGAVDGSGTTNYVTKWSDADTITNSVIYDNGTNVGIGTTSPGYTLDVNGTLHSSNITLADGIYHEGDTNTYINFLSDQIQMATSGSVRAYINSLGNVGIGTTSPIGRLNVVNGSSGQTYSNISGLLIDVNGSNNSYYGLRVGSNTGNNHLSVTNAGNVGIGTASPQSKLHINRTTLGEYFRGGSGGLRELRFSTYNTSSDHAGHKIDASSSNGEITLATGGSARVTVDNTGNVGIGTTSPGAKLDVQGAVTIKGSGTGTSGSLAIQDDYSGENHLANIGWIRSSGGVYLSYGLKQEGSADWKSTYANFSGERTYAKLDNNEFSMAHAPAQNTAVGTAVTGLTEKFKFYLNTGVLQLNSYSAGILSTNSSGTVGIASSEDLPGGPYLPLSAGVDSPLTGDLIISASGNTNLILQNPGGTGNSLLWWKDSSGGNDWYFGQTSENANLNLYNYSSSLTQVQFKTNGTVTFGSDVQVESALLSNQENTDIDSAAAEVVALVAISYTAAFFDFVVKKGTNVRSGTVYACHDGTNVEFTETSTQDLGDTSDVTLSVDISGGNMRLLATVTSDDWSVKSLIRAI